MITVEESGNETKFSDNDGSSNSSSSGSSNGSTNNSKDNMSTVGDVSVSTMNMGSSVSSSISMAAQPKEKSPSFLTAPGTGLDLTGTPEITRGGESSGGGVHEMNTARHTEASGSREGGATIGVGGKPGASSTGASGTGNTSSNSNTSSNGLIGNTGTNSVGLTGTSSAGSSSTGNGGSADGASTGSMMMNALSHVSVMLGGGGRGSGTNNNNNNNNNTTNSNINNNHGNSNNHNNNNTTSVLGSSSSNGNGSGSTLIDPSNGKQAAHVVDLRKNMSNFSSSNSHSVGSGSGAGNVAAGSVIGNGNLKPILPAQSMSQSMAMSTMNTMNTLSQVMYSSSGSHSTVVDVIDEDVEGTTTATHRYHQ